jgi:transposase
VPGFNRLYEATRKRGPIAEAAWWAHGSRKFSDHLAKRLDDLLPLNWRLQDLTAQAA